MRNAYAMLTHSVVLRILLTVLPEPLSECVITTLEPGNILYLSDYQITYNSTFMILIL